MAGIRQSISEAYSAPDWTESNDNSEPSRSAYIRKRKRKSLPKQLPMWLKILNSKLVGVKIREHDKPIIGTIIFVWLLLGALSYLAARFWYLIVDIKNPSTPSTFFTESFTMIITLIWISMGVYSHRLAYYVFCSPSMLFHVRLHSRTFLKFNSSLLIVILVLIFCGLNLRRFLFVPEILDCPGNNFPKWFCSFLLGLGIFYSVPALFFNIVIFVILLSVMRTHTIVLRRQISDLEFDERIIHKIMKLKQEHSIFSLPEIEIQSKDSDEEMYTMEDLNYPQSNVIVDDREMLSNDIELPEASKRDYPTISLHRRYMDLEGKRAKPEEYERLLISTDEINYRYRVLHQRANIISLFFQRWVLCWLLFVVVWTISFVVLWLNHTPNNWDIGLFLLPIIMFWLLASSYAEVNAESKRFFNSICPLHQDRLQLVRFIGMQPIIVGVFQVGLTHTAMISIFLAMGVALLSKIILDEISHR